MNIINYINMNYSKRKNKDNKDITYHIACLNINLFNKLKEAVVLQLIKNYSS